MVHFRKYETSGAYHWVECNRSLRNWQRYNPPLVARYGLITGVARALRPQRLVEVGCGDGYLLGQLSAAARGAAGLELDQRGVQLAKRLLCDQVRTRVIQGDCYAVPVRDAAADLVVMADVIEHLDSPSAALRELARICADGGAVIVTTPRGRPERRPDPEHVQEFTPIELEELLTSVFRDVDIKYFWPVSWIRIYGSPWGWRALKLLGLAGFNPFSGISIGPAHRYDQLFAVCRRPIRRGW